MFRRTHYLLGSCALVSLLVFVPPSPALAQFAGSRGGLEEQQQIQSSFAPLTREMAESFIAITGKAEVRVKPTELRIVLAVTAEGETALDCQKTVDATLAKLKAAWTKLKIPPEAIVVDFIAVLPRYEWKMEKRGEENVGVEKKSGYRMQTNVHLAVAGDKEALPALGAAFEQGVTDIIAFDYWSKELDAVKEQTREQALSAARGKADMMLKVLFTEQPPVINVQEQTTVHYPDSLYHSFTNTVDEDVIPAHWRGQTIIRAQRPKNTYYRGFYSGGDIQPRDLPMKSEISVVSTVRLYFESPAAPKRVKKELKE
ncbi:MAG: SIMPL domain-containing protein [Pirellulaceae bacterium]|nr:SIMPL domain-containing protein [Pirellulaceae bacterium]